MNLDEMKQANELLSMMFHAFPQSVAVDADVRAQVYLAAIKFADFRDFQSALNWIVQGIGDHKGRQFSPSTAELCLEISSHERRRKLEDKPVNSIQAKRPKWLVEWEAKNEGKTLQ